MAFISGTANSFPELVTALATAAQGQGYTVTDAPDSGPFSHLYYNTSSIRRHGKFLVKGGRYYKIDVYYRDSQTLNPEYMGLHVGTSIKNDGIYGNNLFGSDGEYSSFASINGLGSCAIGRHNVTNYISFPAKYYIFSFSGPDEIYMVVQYKNSSNRLIHQYLAFGESSLANILPGNGAWISGSVLYYIIHDVTTTTSPSTIFTSKSSFVRHNYSTQGLNLLTYYGLSPSRPNELNEESVLRPLRAVAARESAMNSLVAELVYARSVSTANVEPEGVIQLGANRWMVFPWYERTASDTLGWAIRYDGP
jgi:hypothetical protein